MESLNKNINIWGSDKFSFQTFGIKKRTCLKTVGFKKQCEFCIKHNEILGHHAHHIQFILLE